MSRTGAEKSGRALSLKITLPGAREARAFFTMSLFSRLDRLRTRDSQAESKAKAEDGLFTVPDLSPARDAGQVPPPLANPSAEAQGKIQSVTFAPVDLSAPAAEEISARAESSPFDRLKGAARADDGPKFAPVSLDLGVPAPLADDIADDENSKSSMFAAAPFKLPDLNEINHEAPAEVEAPIAAAETEASEPETEAVEEIEPAADEISSAPPIAATPAVEASVAEAPAFQGPAEPPVKSAPSPFERLMAARAAQTDAPSAARAAEISKAATPAPKPPTPNSPTPAAQIEAPPAPRSETPEAAKPATLEAPPLDTPRAALPLEVEADEAAQVAAITSQSLLSAPMAELEAEEISAAVGSVETLQIQDVADEISLNTAPQSELASEAVSSENLPSEESPSENLSSEPPPKTALSLADRLARVPRAELESARAEAQDLAPEVLSEAAPKLPAPKLPAPIPFVPKTAPIAASENSAPAPEKTMPAPIETPPADAKPRSFSERLAARTGLDRHLQVPAESAPETESLAPSHTELARIDEGAQFSEREMKKSRALSPKAPDFRFGHRIARSAHPAKPDQRSRQTRHRTRR